MILPDLRAVSRTSRFEHIVGDQKIESQQPAFSTPAPIAWTVAGSDSGGGAGIQADLKVMNAFGVHGCCAITAVTAQNTVHVASVQAVSEPLFSAQLEALAHDLPPGCIKTGMLGSADVCRIFAEFLASYPAPDPMLVCDPVLQSTSGTNLLDPAAMDILLQGIIPRTTVLTPNLPEAETLLGTRVERMEDAAERLLTKGAHSVLIKGGHADTVACRDYWTDGCKSLWLSSPRIDTRATHGTGCILSAALASMIASGHAVPEAVIAAKTYLNQCLRMPANLGKGHGPMEIRPFLNAEEDRPEIQ